MRWRKEEGVEEMRGSDVVGCGLRGCYPALARSTLNPESSEQRPSRITFPSIKEPTHVSQVHQSTRQHGEKTRFV